jgi:hypothetical protein
MKALGFMASVIAVLLSGCAGAHSYVADRAEVDLSCPRESIVVQDVGSWALAQYVARGCGKRAVYVAQEFGLELQGGVVAE